MELTTAYLQQKLSLQPHLRHYYVAYSGGVDSHVLLFLLHQLRQQQSDLVVTAIHVNHGLQVAADDWTRHCQTICDDLDIPLLNKPVSIALDQGQSPEAAARAARYGVFRDIVGSDEGLLMAHHQDDQAETALLQLFRGAGVAGLSAMPESMPFEKGVLLRPLLGLSRQKIETYAREHGLNWIEDPSNQDTNFDRNFLRHDIIPQLTSRWPALNTTISRAVSHQAEAAKLLEVLAKQDYQLAQAEVPQTLSVSALRMLDVERQRNLLRYWFKQVCQLPIPDQRHLQRILDEVLTAAIDTNPLVQWSGTEVRRYRDALYAQTMVVLEEADESIAEQRWDLNKPFLLCHGQQLEVEQAKGKGLKQSLLQDNEVSVRFRQGGEECRPLGRGHRHSLKKLMQEWAIPPWQRDGIALIYVGDELAQVVGHCFCEPFQVESDEIGLFISQTGV